jgi:photosystem II stability/assembly factor-like uncharacterized protein
MLTPFGRNHLQRYLAHVGHATAWLMAAALLSACAPEMIPIPVTQGPTVAPPSPTALDIGGRIMNPPDLLSIRMLDATNGWGIGDTAILRTADGGRTWHDMSPTGVATLGYSVCSEFLDSERGWVLVPNPNDMLHGILYQTVDGGGNWTETPVPFGGGSLHFLDAKRGWMMANLGAGAGSMGVAIFQTEDGGLTWTQTYTNDPNQPGAGSSLPLGGLKDGITVLSLKSAWIGGVTYAPGTLYLFETRDGGRTWSRSPVAVPPGYQQAEVETTGPTFADPDVGFLPVHLSTQNGVMLAVYVSRDAGASWLLSPTFIPQGGSTDFVSAKTGFVWNGTDIYVTNDAAQSWTIVVPDVNFGDSFSGMDFVSPQVGFILTSDASGARALFRTVDGGATWNVLAR